jgi:hypothetical protein
MSAFERHCNAFELEGIYACDMPYIQTNRNSCYKKERARWLQVLVIQLCSRYTFIVHSVDSDFDFHAQDGLCVRYVLCKYYVLYICR